MCASALWLPPTQVTASSQYTSSADDLEQGFLHAERPVYRIPISNSSCLIRGAKQIPPSSGNTMVSVDRFIIRLDRSLSCTTVVFRQETNDTLPRLWAQLKELKV